MNSKLKDYFVCIVFCLAVFAVFAFYLLMPQSAFSEKEKRYLQTFSAPDWSSVVSGDFGRSTEKAAADQLPGRDFLLNLYARFDKLLNLQSTKDILVGESGRLYERPHSITDAAMRLNMMAINDFSKTVGQNVNLMLVPSAGYFMAADMPGDGRLYDDDDIISAVYGLAGENLDTLQLFDDFGGYEDPAQLYYKTDHHWTSLGAYIACRHFLSRVGREAIPQSEYSVETVPGFHGSEYSRACFWDIPAENLELWDDGLGYTVTIAENDTVHQGLFFRERLSELDKYPVWLDGNHPLITIENSSPQAEGSLLIIRDSFASCFAGFAAAGYEKVTLVDLRYYKLPVSQLCEEEGFDDILIMYYLGNFCTDSNIAWLS